jgi:crossover junction endodeoxyribonuclease RuvC
VFDRAFSDRAVLGIDPGLSRCGYGAIVRKGALFEPVAYGVLRTDPKSPLPSRLAALEADLEDLMAEVQPGAVAVERVLFQVNARTAISVGQASGLALAVAARAGVPVVQYSPNEVKLAVTGDGAADKLAVQTMVTRLLDLPSAPQPADAADALALALCHSWRARIDGGVPAVDASVPSRLQTAISAALASAPAQRNPR